MVTVGWLWEQGWGLALRAGEGTGSTSFMLPSPHCPPAGPPRSAGIRFGQTRDRVFPRKPLTPIPLAHLLQVGWDMVQLQVLVPEPGSGCGLGVGGRTSAVLRLWSPPGSSGP